MVGRRGPEVKERASVVANMDYQEEPEASDPVRPGEKN